ncbi:MAG TPA: extracellular solute-binding protein [Candidatus Acidoferrales bacterium]|nr:extracellular solute-binding protein [Candidatus Acidoferrales bacterium]
MICCDRKKLLFLEVSMTIRTVRAWVLGALLVNICASSAIYAAAAPGVLKAKQEAEAKGFIFETSRDEIIAKAKKEGKLRVLSSLEIETLKPVSEAFKRKYPFIDIRAEEIAGTDTYQRMLLEMKAGTGSGWDVNYLTTDFYDDYLPHQKKFDILGMAQHGVLQIPLGMIDPVNRNVVSYTTRTQVTAYNKKLISEDKVPSVWEDFLKPEFKGRKFAVDIRPQEVANLVPAWGLEKTLQYAKGLAAQNPIWIRGHSRVIAAMAAGEYAMLLGANLNSTKRAMEKDKANVLAYKLTEPIPLRIGDHEAVYAKADSPYAALLWLEFVGGPEAQKIIELQYNGSVFFPGTTAHQATQGKKVSIIGWEHAPKLEELQKKVFETYGFPKAEPVGKR